MRIRVVVGRLQLMTMKFTATNRIFIASAFTLGLQITKKSPLHHPLQPSILSSSQYGLPYMALDLWCCMK